jgi:SAM-dependent methyltransferase
MSRFQLPYFDQIIDKLDNEPDSTVALAFRRHYHWGYFDTPEAADDSLDRYLVAAEAMTERVCDAAGVADGQRILDVGCGFGGTLDHLNHRLSDCELVGLNIDGRQLRKARLLVEPRSANKVSFVEADACRLPFPTASFDVVLAVECIFHFASRKQFFREARRVVTPGGSLALSDFVLQGDSIAEAGEWMTSGDQAESAFYGSNSRPLTSGGYQRIGAGSGFERLTDDDVTANTLPTYPSMRRLYRESNIADGEAATDYLEESARQGVVGYHILSFGARDR